MKKNNGYLNSVVTVMVNFENGIDGAELGFASGQLEFSPVVSVSLGKEIIRIGSYKGLILQSIILTGVLFPKLNPDL